MINIFLGKNNSGNDPRDVGASSSRKVEVRKEFPVKAFIIGIILQLIYIVFLFGYRCFYYVRGLTYTWTENYFDFCVVLGGLLIYISLMSLLNRGKEWKIDVDAMAIIFTFLNMSWPLTMLIARGPSTPFLVPIFNKDLAFLMPDWMKLPMEEAEKMYHGGIPNWSAWAVPFLFWSVHLISVLFLCFFLMSIWRREWIEVERLPYPHAIPMYELINMGVVEKGEARIFKEKWIWYGVLVAFLIYIWDPLRSLSGGLIPRFPDFTIHYADWYKAPNLSLLPQTKGLILLAFSPAFMVGAYLLPLDVLQGIIISIILFDWLKPMLGIATGFYPDISKSGWWPFFLSNGWWFYPPNMTLGWGMWIGIALWCFWIGRDHIKNIIAVLQKKPGAIDDPVLSYRISVPLFFLSAIIWIVTMLVTGATPILTIAFAILFIIWFQAIGRIKGEFWWGGRPLRVGGSVKWLALTYYYIPTGEYNTSGAQMFTLFFDGEYGSASLAQHCGFPPRINDCYKVGREVGASLKYIALAGVVSIIIGVLWAYFVRIIWAYNAWGGTYGYPKGNEGAGLSKDIYSGEYPEKGAYAGGIDVYAMGAILAIILLFLKSRFVWWPINPIGFMAPIAGFWILPWEFLSFFFAWIWKYAVWKIGGAVLHRKMIRFVIGYIATYAIINVIEWIIDVFIVGPANVPPPW